MLSSAEAPVPGVKIVSKSAIDDLGKLSTKPSWKEVPIWLIYIHIEAVLTIEPN